MILGLGSDICSVERVAQAIARHGDAFIDLLFTAGERREGATPAATARLYALRFAAKEACAKALGTGIDGSIDWRDVEVGLDPRVAPRLALKGGALARLRAMAPEGSEARTHLALARSGGQVTAMVLIEACGG